MCPYDFLTDFDNWFAWHKFVHFDKLTPEQATTNVTMMNRGWGLSKGFNYGMWQYSNPKTLTKHQREEISRGYMKFTTIL
jgi:hypothetical protein